MRHAFAAPAIATESTRQLASVRPCEHARRQIPDGLQSLADYSRRTQKYSVGEEQFLRDFIRVRRHHIVHADVYVSALFYSLAYSLREHSRVAVCADIWHNNRRLGIGADHRRPFFICIEHPLYICIQHGTVPGTYHVHFQRPDPFECIQHKRFERPDNAVIVILRSAEIALAIRNLAHQYVVHSIVRAERVACNQSFILANISVHRVRPMQVGHDYEFQRLVVQLQRLTVFYRYRVEILVYNFF